MKNARHKVPRTFTRLLHLNRKDLTVNINAYIIKALKFLAQFKILTIPVYRMIMNMPISEERRQNVALYVFGKVRIRPLRKGVDPAPLWVKRIRYFGFRRRLKATVMGFWTGLKRLPFTLMVKTLRFIGRIRFLERPLYRLLMRLPYDKAKRRRLTHYVFGKVRLRPLKKGNSADPIWRQAYRFVPEGQESNRFIALLKYLNPVPKIKRGVFAVTEFTLRFALKLRLDFVVESFFRLVERTSIQDDRFNSFAERVYRDRTEPLNLGQFFLAPAVEVSRRSNFSMWNYQSSTALDAADVIHVILDQKTSIPDLLLDASFRDKQFVFYAFDNIDTKLEKLGISDRSRLSTLRDQFNEISEEGEDLYDQSHVFSKGLIEALQYTVFNRAGIESDRFNEALALTLDTYISTRMTLVMCVQQALAKLQTNDTVLIVTNKGGLVSDGWDILQSDVQKPNIHFAFSGTQRRAAHFFDTLAKPDASSMPVDDPDFTTIFEKSLTRVEDIASLINTGANAFSKNLSSLIDNREVVLLVHGQTGDPYKKTVEQLGHKLIKNATYSNFPIPIFLHMGLDPEKDIVPRLIKHDTQSDALFIGIDVMRELIMNASLHKNQPDIIIDELIARYSEPMSIYGTTPERIIRAGLKKTLFTALPWAFMSYRVGTNLTRDLNVHGAMASTSRHWLTRMFCCGLLDGQDTLARQAANEMALISSDIEADSEAVEIARDEDILLPAQKRAAFPIIDVQTLNSIEHPKYRAPMATHAAVIDKRQASLMADYLGYPEDKIFLSGAPQNDSIRSDVASTDTKRHKIMMGIPESGRIVTVVSQLQPMDRMAKIVRPIAEYVAKTENAYLTIRMHPREGADRVQSYKEILSDIPSDKIYFSTREASYEIIAVSDVCVTIYSNMAREMAMMGVPVACVQYLDWMPPIDLVKEGLAIPASSPEALKQQISKILDRPQSDKDSNWPEYFTDNPHLIGAQASDIIVDKFAELYGTQLFNADVGKADAINGEGLANTSKTEINKEEKITLVVGSRLGISDIPPVFERSAKLHVYIADDSGHRGLLPSRMVVHSGAYSSKNSDNTTRAVRDADAFLKVLIDAVTDQLKDWPSIFRQIAPLSRSMWLRQRTRMIAAFRTHIHMEHGLEEALGGKLVICANDIPSVMHMALSALGKGHKIRDVRALIINKDRTYTHLSGVEFFEQHDQSILSAQRATNLNQLRLTNGLKLVEQWARTIESRPAETFSGRRILITTDWRLKTVPPTLKPVIEHELSKGTQILLFNTRPADVDDIRFELSTIKNQSDESSLEVRSVDDFDTDVLAIAPRVSLWITNGLAASILEEPFFKQQSPDIWKVAESSIKAYFRPHLPMLICMHKLTKDFFAQPGAISLACPGRQWHAEIAHTVAETDDRLAMTLQNAYMTAGYTYTKPTGNYVTAIDQWSKTLFMDTYDVPEKLIHVTSTPRFDYLGELAKMDSATAREDLNLAKDEVFVLFAAQVGYEAEAERVISALAEIETIGGKTPRIIAKLHPRTDSKEIERYRTVAFEANPNHHVSIVSDTRIYEYLAASDIVITLFSNVGTEAAILGKKLIIVNFEDDPLPVPMDLFGFSHVAKSEAAIKQAIFDYTDDEGFIEAQSERIEAFKTDNPVMVTGQSLNVIGDALAAGIERSLSRAVRPHKRDAKKVKS